MNDRFFYDTETTGFPLWSQPSDDIRQPHLVQLAWIIGDKEGSRIIKPEGWTIPDEVAKIHGITTERALDEGLPLRVVIDEFVEDVVRKDSFLHRVAHNESFDSRIMRIALKRARDSLSNDWVNGASECTMAMSVSLCKIPPTPKMRAAKRFGFKSPNLREAYKHFTGLELDGAHDAINDVRACRAVYLAIKGGDL